jgi:hypothetical protein
LWPVGDNVLLCAILSEFLFLLNTITEKDIINHLHIADFDSEVLHELFPLKVCNRGPFHAKFNKNKNSESIAHSNTLSPTGHKNQRT